MQKLKAMKPLETIYWLRLALGITAAKPLNNQIVKNY